MRRHSKTCCVVVKLDLCLLSAANSQTVFLDTQVATFTRHRSRLAVVREQKEKARLDMLGENKSCVHPSIFYTHLIHLRVQLPWIHHRDKTVP